MPDPIADAADRLDAHVRDTVAWHFSPDTGTPHWLDFAEHTARPAGWDPLTGVRGFADLIARFDPFDGELLRYTPHDRFIPKAFAGRPYHVFETGGTTGMPKQRIAWDDHKTDYEAFSATLDDAHFPMRGNWLMIGPTGPRRLRLAIEHLANFRGSSCYFVDLDPRWVKRVIAEGDAAQAKAYMRHVIDQARTILKHRGVTALFTTPKLLESLAEAMSIPDAGIKGVFVGGTTMTPQYARFLVEEVLEHKVGFYPTYGNTLMGLAAHRPFNPDDPPEARYSITYHAPQPRAVLRVVNPDDPATVVGYDQWGRVELTTLTKELFLPRFLERDQALRRRPCDAYPWDGVAEVKPFDQEASSGAIVEGVY